jgi:hypothetical protein
MSQINTGPINVNYPVPGVKNSTQGFRDNFVSIKNNLDITSSEISELQNKVVLKSPLEGITLNNDMANTLISNALTSGFRQTTYNLGSNLTGPIVIDINKGDVQYGTIGGNVQFGVTSWGPNNTQSSVKLILSVPTEYANSSISIPGTVDSSKETLENYSSSAVTVPNGVTQVQYDLSTIDGGSTVTINPTNRPRKATQITTDVPASPVGRVGDVLGTIATDGNYIYVCTGTYNGTTNIWKRVSSSVW